MRGVSTDSRLLLKKLQQFRLHRYHCWWLRTVEAGQPTPRGDIDSMAEVRSRIDVPIMADESVFTLDQAYEVIRKKAADVISIYPGKNGGILKSKLISQMAASAGISCHIGSNLEWDVATSAMCHLAVCCGNIHITGFPPDILGPLYYDTRLARPVEFANGLVSTPTGPGLGLDISEDEIAAISRQDGLLSNDISLAKTSA